MHFYRYAKTKAQETNEQMDQERNYAATRKMLTLSNAIKAALNKALREKFRLSAQTFSLGFSVKNHRCTMFFRVTITLL